MVKLYGSLFSNNGGKNNMSVLKLFITVLQLNTDIEPLGLEKPELVTFQ